jgi:hypothetical protein
VFINALINFLYPVGLRAVHGGEGHEPDVSGEGPGPRAGSDREGVPSAVRHLDSRSRRSAARTAHEYSMTVKGGLCSPFSTRQKKADCGVLFPGSLSRLGCARPRAGRAGDQSPRGDSVPLLHAAEPALEPLPRLAALGRRADRAEDRLFLLTRWVKCTPPLPPMPKPGVEVAAPLSRPSFPGPGEPPAPQGNAPWFAGIPQRLRT